TSDSISCILPNSSSSSVFAPSAAFPSESEPGSRHDYVSPEASWAALRILPQQLRPHVPVQLVMEYVQCILSQLTAQAADSVRQRRQLQSPQQPQSRQQCLQGQRVSAGPFGSPSLQKPLQPLGLDPNATSQNLATKANSDLMHGFLSSLGPRSLRKQHHSPGSDSSQTGEQSRLEPSLGDRPLTSSVSMLSIPVAPVGSLLGQTSNGSVTSGPTMGLGSLAGRQPTTGSTLALARTPRGSLVRESIANLHQHLLLVVADQSKASCTCTIQELVDSNIEDYRLRQAELALLAGLAFLAACRKSCLFGAAFFPVQASGNAVRKHTRE
ncbi:unnamed protein product, partial [Protopolystoma xenopodis]